MQLVDTHCHLDFEDYNDDLGQVIENSLSNGVVRMIIPGTTLESSKKAVDIAKKYPSVYAAVGIHPHYADPVTDDDIEGLRELALSEEKVIAIGEIGLDYFKGFSDVDKQKDMFKKVLRIASEINLPVIVHNREADTDIVSMLSDENAHRLRGVMHCFSGDIDLLERMIAMDLYISFAGNITFPKAAGLREMLKKVPVERLLLETDSPYLSPVPVRGKRNEPSNLKYLLDLYKGILEVSQDDIARVTTVNADSLFKLGLEEGSKIAYQIRESLYLNITNSCTNRCTFCTRDISAYVKGHNLRLDHEPSADEVIMSMGDVSKYDEIVFCGFGEPSMRLDVIKQVASYAKKHGKKVRMVSNGEGDLINKRPIVPEIKGLVDRVSVSLNAPDAEFYDHICRSVFGKEAYTGLLGFIKNCRDGGIEVEVTCLDFIGEENIEKCRNIAASMGTSFRLRNLNKVG